MIFFFQKTLMLPCSHIDGMIFFSLMFDANQSSIFPVLQMIFVEKSTKGEKMPSYKHTHRTSILMKLSIEVKSTKFNLGYQFMLQLLKTGKLQ